MKGRYLQPQVRQSVCILNPGLVHDEEEPDVSLAWDESVSNENSPSLAHPCSQSGQYQLLGSGLQRKSTEVTSVVSSGSEEATIVASEQRTQQKNFNSRQNPLLLKRRFQKQEGYIWFAVYDEQVDPAIFKKSPAARFSEMFQIHVKDFALAFSVDRSGDSDMTFPFLQSDENKIVFLQVYLMPRTLLEQHLKIMYGVNVDLKNSPLQNMSVGQSMFLDSDGFYDCLTKVCKLEDLDVVTINANPSFSIEEAPCVPQPYVLASLFKSYCAAFSNYTEHFLLYYFYKLNQVQSSYAIDDLLEVADPNLLAKQQHLKEEQPTLRDLSGFLDEDATQTDINCHSDNASVKECRSVDALAGLFGLNLMDLPDPNSAMKAKVRLEYQDKLKDYLNVASESSFGLGGKIVQNFKGGSRNGSLRQQSEMSELGRCSFNKSVVSLSGYTNGTHFFGQGKKKNSVYDLFGSQAK